MTRLVWDPKKAPPVSYGLDRGVLYFRSAPIVWNGLSKVTERTEGSDFGEFYYDGLKYTQQMTPDSFAASIEAFSYPEELDLEEVFNLTYRVTLDTGYEIHLVYNASVSPSESTWNGVNPDLELSTFVLDLTTVPLMLNSYRATSHFVINSNYATSAVIDAIEAMLYGTNTSSPDIPNLVELLAIFEQYALFVVIDNGDGTWTATGPDSWFQAVDGTTTNITTPSVDIISDDVFVIQSW